MALPNLVLYGKARDVLFCHKFYRTQFFLGGANRIFWFIHNSYKILTIKYTLLSLSA